MTTGKNKNEINKKSKKKLNLENVVYEQFVVNALESVS
jgi:hypothetical protein